VDALLLTILDQVVALEDGVALNLVRSGNNTGTIDDSLKLSEMVSWCKDILDILKYERVQSCG
jgi:hypothetical protein